MLEPDSEVAQEIAVLFATPETVCVCASPSLRLASDVPAQFSKLFLPPGIGQVCQPRSPIVFEIPVEPDAELDAIEDVSPTQSNVLARRH